MALTGGKNRTQRPIAFDSGIVSIGDTATLATGINSTAVGSFATSLGNECVSLGHGAYCGGLRSVSIGKSSSDGGFDHGIALGSNASTLGIYGMALGADSIALANAIALGRSAATVNPNELAVGSLIAPITKADFPGVTTLAFHTTVGIEFTHDASTDGGPTAFTMTGGTYIDTAGTRNNFHVTSTFAPAAGNANFNTLNLNYTSSLGGVASGRVTGLLVKETVTTALGRHEIIRAEDDVLGFGRVHFKVYGQLTGGGIGAYSILTPAIYGGSLSGTESGGTATTFLDLVGAGGATTMGQRLRADANYTCATGDTIHAYVAANLVTSSATDKNYWLSRFDYLVNQTDPGNTGTVIGIGLQARETAIVGKHYLMDLGIRVGVVVTSKFRVTNTAEIQLSDGAVVVSDASTGKLAYKTSTQQFYASMNGAAYVPLLYAPAAAGFTQNYVPFGSATGTLTESADFQFNPTTKILSLSDRTTITNASVLYASGDASLAITRTGNLTGLVGENVNDLKIAPNFTLTTPGAAPMFKYNGANIDLTNLNVNGFYGEIAALRLTACPDASIDAYSYAMIADGVVGMFRGITGIELLAAYGGLNSWVTQVDVTTYLGSLSLSVGNASYVGACKWVKSRSTDGDTAATVLNNDYIASFEFDGDDGNDIKTTAAIMDVRVDGAPALNSIPGRFVWSTAGVGDLAPSERMRLTGTGNLLIGTATDVASTRLRVQASKSVAVGVGAWNGIDFMASTLTLTGGPAVVTSLTYFNIAGPTITSAAADTVTDLQTMLVGVPAAPAGGAGLTFTNVWSATFAGSVRHLGRDEWNQGTTTPAATTLTLPEDGNGFPISAGTGVLDRIESVRWRAGSIIVLRFTGAVTISSDTAAAGTALGLKLAGSAGMNAVDGTMLVLYQDGSFWQEITRKGPS